MGLKNHKVVRILLETQQFHNIYETLIFAINKMERNLKSTIFQGAVQEIAIICNERQFETAVLSSMWDTHGHRHKIRQSSI